MSALQIRRGTASAITAANPTLAAGEPVLETDTGLLKVGDGTTAWTSLPYYHPGIPVGGSTGQVLAKASGDARDTEWVTPYRPPLVKFLDADSVVTGSTTYIDTMSLAVSPPPTSGMTDYYAFEAVLVILAGGTARIKYRFTKTNLTGSVLRYAWDLDNRIAFQQLFDTEQTNQAASTNPRLSTLKGTLSVPYENKDGSIKLEHACHTVTVSESATVYAGSYIKLDYLGTVGP